MLAFFCRDRYSGVDHQVPRKGRPGRLWDYHLDVHPHQRDRPNAWGVFRRLALREAGRLPGEEGSLERQSWSAALRFLLWGLPRPRVLPGPEHDHCAGLAFAFWGAGILPLATGLILSSVPVACARSRLPCRCFCIICLATHWARYCRASFRPR